MHLGEYDPSVSFPADWGILGTHARRNIHFANGRAYHFPILLLRDVVNNSAGRKVGDDRTLATPKNDLCRERKSVVLANRLTLIGDESEAIDIGVDGKADIGLAFLYKLLELSKVFGDWLWRPGKHSIGLQIYRRHTAAELFEKLRHDCAAGSTHAVERDMKATAPNAVNVDKRERENLRNVPVNG